MFLNVRTGVFFAVALGLLVWTTARQVDLFAFGCDGFGYARQAQLFRDKGLLRGLDTYVDAPEAGFIIGVAKSVSSNSAQWSEAVAPHCHHYVAAVDRVVIEYPPGTGLILSLFPENRSLAFAFVIGMTLISAVFVLLIVLTRSPNGAGGILALIIMALFDVTMMQPGAKASASVPVSMALIPFCAWLALVAFPPREKNGNVGLAIAFGLVAGLLVATRLANVLLVAGVTCAIVINRQLWRPAMVRQSVDVSIAAIGGFVLTGGGLVLTANWLNVGTPFATTYSPIDATLPVLSERLLTTNLAYYYYMGKGFPAAAMLAATAALVLRGLVLCHRPGDWSSHGAFIGAFVCFGLSLIFFCTHPIRVPYYMLPASGMTLSLIAFDVLLGQTAKDVSKISALSSAVLVAPFLLFIVVRCVLLNPFSPRTTVPDEVRGSQAIVWADLTSGTLLYYQHKYAAKIVFADACIQQRLITEIARSGRPQYFIEDSSAMAEVIHRIAKSLQIQQIGSFEALAKYPIWKLDGSLTFEGIHWCP